MSKKVFVKTYGCQMNEYDSDKIVDVLNQAEGLTRTDTPEGAEMIVFNTCSIREKAQEKVFSDLGRVQHLKKKNPDLIVAVGGCVASQEGKAIIQRSKLVDIVFGPQTLHRLPELIAERRATGKAQVDISFPEIEKFDHLPPAKVEGVTAFVSIMEGCSKFCSYCIVPFTRGQEVSRPLESILVEIAGLAQQGVKEVTLLGQNVNAYRGTLEEGEVADFALLLEYVHEIPGIERIRYTTSHPREVTPRLIDCYRTLPKLVSHLHLPIQSGSDRVLSAMKRGYTVLEFKSLVRQLRQARPDLSLSSDFIVGFPGETDEDFEKTMQVIEDIGFDASFSFIYSPRPGTPAAELSDSTPGTVKNERLMRLQARIEELANEVSQRMVGTVQRVLVEGFSKKSSEELTGRTDNNRTVNFQGEVAQLHQFLDVRITQAFSHSLRGEIMRESLLVEDER